MSLEKIDTAGKQIVVFAGDSITDAGRNYEEDYYTGVGYPTLVKSRLNFECPNQYAFFNRGVNGMRIVDLYARIHREVLVLKPDYLSILVGVNDAWHELLFQAGIPEKKYEILFNMLISDIREALPETKIMILEPFILEGSSTRSTEERPGKWEYLKREVNLRAQAAQRVAEKNSIVFIPLQQKFDVLLNSAPASNWLLDGVHPTAAGHELIAREWITAFHQISKTQP